MRKLLIAAAFLFAAISGLSQAGATVAKPGPITVQQPDGSSLVIYMHGDEFGRWITDDQGNILKQDADGWYRIASSQTVSDFSKVYSDNHITRESAYVAPNKSISIGNNHFLVVLIEFPDLKFTIDNPNQAFSDMLNKKGYSDNSGTGSVRDYYYDNSNGKFNPVFDVVGPIMVSGNYAYYGGNDSDDDDLRPRELIVEACDSANRLYPSLDFSIYDLDGDRYVDNVFYYFAGHNEAEGGGANTIWPHSWSAYNVDQSKRYFDGVYIYHYACSSEYSGSSGTRRAGIGTFCHEFGHVIGLPDFYDTDYSTNGSSNGLWNFSLMSSGNYNNSGHTPPYLTGEERHMLGWMDEAQEWTELGSKTIKGIQNNVAYRINTGNSGEYFQFEVRPGTGWDAYVAKGLLVYHIDKSSNKVGTSTAASLWSSGYKINAYGDHPCMHIEPAKSSYGTNYVNVPFPGGGGVTTFDTSNGATAWSGTSLGVFLKDLSWNSKDTTVTGTLYKDTRMISGTIKDSDGKAVEGATLTISENAAKPAEQACQIVTASDGKYSYVLNDKAGSSFTITVECYGYEKYSETISISASSTTKNVTLSKLNYGGGGTATLKLYDKASKTSVLEGKNVSGEAVAKISSAMLKNYVGNKITAISYMVYGQANADVTVKTLMFFGSTSKVSRDKTVKAYTLGTDDISSLNLTVPSDKDIYVGYKMSATSTKGPGQDKKKIFFLTDSGASKQSGGFYTRRDSNSSWSEQDTYPLIVSITIQGNATENEQMGYHSIDIVPGATYSAGTVFTPLPDDAGETYKTISWTFDDKPVSGNQVTLTKGEHLVRMTMTFSDGRTETVLQEIKVE